MTFPESDRLGATMQRIASFIDGYRMRRSLGLALIASLWFVGVVAFAQKPASTATPSNAPSNAPSMAADAASGEAGVASARAQLIGRWEEYSPSRNFVDFLDDGRVVLHLKQGEIGTLKTLDGVWKIETENALRVDFTVNGQTFGRTAGLRFEAGEMLLLEPAPADTVTRHRRYEGELPDDYRW